MNNKILKEVIIILLLLVVILFSMGILFYDTLSSSNVDDVLSVEYKTSESVEAVLNEIQASSEINEKSENADSILKSYSINQEDLMIYASENSYESGKKDPFAESSEKITEYTTTTTVKGTESKAQSPNKVVAEDNKTEEKTTNTITSATLTNTLVQNTTVQNTNVKNNNEVKKTETTSKKTETFFEDVNSK